MENYNKEDEIEILRQLSKTPEGQNKIAENFDNIVKKLRYNQIPKFIEICTPVNVLNDLVCSKLDILLSKYTNTKIISQVQELLAYNPKAVNDNIDTIIKICPERSVIKMLRNLKSIEEIRKEAYSKYEYIIERVFNPIIESLKRKPGINVVHKKESLYLKEDIIEEIFCKVIKEDCQDIVELVFKDIYKIEGLQSNMIEPQFIENGNFAIASKILDKTFKIGRAKEVFDIPYHPRILQPILRRQSKEKDLCIEVFPYIDVESEITDKELLTVYKELEKDGIIWTDASKRNLGRLIKPNTIDEKYGIRDDSKGFGIYDSGIERKILQPGEVVILDLDYLYKQGEKDIKQGVNDRVINFYNINYNDRGDLENDYVL